MSEPCDVIRVPGEMKSLKTSSSPRKAVCDLGRSRALRVKMENLPANDNTSTQSVTDVYPTLGQHFVNALCLNLLSSSSISVIILGPVSMSHSVLLWLKPQRYWFLIAACHRGCQTVQRPCFSICYCVL